MTWKTDDITQNIKEFAHSLPKIWTPVVVDEHVEGCVHVHHSNDRSLERYAFTVTADQQELMVVKVIRNFRTSLRQNI